MQVYDGINCWGEMLNEDSDMRFVFCFVRRHDLQSDHSEIAIVKTKD